MIGNSLGAGQSATLSGPSATGMATQDVAGAIACTVANVARFLSWDTKTYPLFPPGRDRQGMSCGSWQVCGRCAVRVGAEKQRLRRLWWLVPASRGTACWLRGRAPVAGAGDPRHH